MVDSRLLGESLAISREGAAKGLLLSIGSGIGVKGEATGAASCEGSAAGLGGGGGGGGANGRLVGGASRPAKEPDGAPAALCFLAAAAASFAISSEERDDFRPSRTSQITSPTKVANRIKNPLVRRDEYAANPLASG